jgi:outer membrane protein OmpA-like peptidoglycan-associated protein
MTDANGNFSASFPIPTGLEVGQHTVQLDGYSPTGEIRSANLKVLVQKYVGKVVAAKFYFEPNQATISKANASAIAKLVKGVGAGYKDLKVGVVGFVYPYDTKKANATLSKQRANNVVALLKKLGLNGVFVAKGAGRTLPADKTARRVDVNLTYQVATTTN